MHLPQGDPIRLVRQQVRVCLTSIRLGRRFDEYLAQAETVYTGTKILANAGGLPKEKADKEAVKTLFEVRAALARPGPWWSVPVSALALRSVSAELQRFSVC